MGFSGDNFNPSLDRVEGYNYHMGHDSPKSVLMYEALVSHIVLWRVVALPPIIKFFCSLFFSISVI